MFQCSVWYGCSVCFSVQFGMTAVCFLSYNLERMLCVFQCSVWDGC